MILFVFFIALICDSVLSGVIPIVLIRDGLVRGQQYVTDNNKTYFGFQGIPYAAPPVGALRFEPPKPPKPWWGILNATEDSKACVSSKYHDKQDTESEDCLYINVYTPKFESKPWNRLPVMFWIYGGDFVQGNSIKSVYGPDFIMEEDVILVTFNYRLGPLGFLSTGDQVIPGNNGLKDQNFALKWTYDNIVHFGGNPNQITIFGQSAGAVSVASHILSKKSKGLFRAAIVESASALVPWALDLDPRTYAFKLANKAGYNGNDSMELREFLRKLSVMELFTATNYLKLNWPVLEVPSADAFLTQPNYALLQSGKFNRVPTIIGICSEESVSFLINNFIAKVEAVGLDIKPDMLIPGSLHLNWADTIPAIIKIRDLYIRENESFYSNITGLAEFLSDNMFARGVIKHAELQSSFTPVYLYQFAYYGRPYFPASIDVAEKVGHAQEIPFIFRTLNMTDNDPDNMLAQKRLVHLWTNFAKYMNPTPLKIPLLNNIQWPKVRPGNLQYLNFNNTLTVKPSLKGHMYRIWGEIFEQYGIKPFVTY